MIYLDFHTEKKNELIIALLNDNPYKKKQSLQLILIFSVFLSSIIPPILRTKADFLEFLLVGNLKNNIRQQYQPIKLDKAMKVDTSIKSYLYFDFKNFVQIPYTNYSDPSLGKDYFWNFLLKTSLFGVLMPGNNLLTNSFACFICFLLLVMILYTAIGYITKKSIESRDSIILLMHLLILISALIFVRTHYEFSFSSEFRYIYPVLISFIYFFIDSMREFKVRNVQRIYYLGIFLGISFCISSVLFFLTAFGLFRVI